MGHKPGFVYSTDASLNDAKERAYAAYDREQSEAYKHPPGWRGGLDGGGELHDQSDDDAAYDALEMDERERAYVAYERALTQAWRGPRDSGKW